jgi:hypothetical protein
MNGKSRLACSTRTDESNQARFFKQVNHFGNLFFAADKTGQLNWQIMTTGVKRIEGRKIRWETLDNQLKDMPAR